MRRRSGRPRPRSRTIDLRREPAGDGADLDADTPPGDGADLDAETPPGTLLVPLDAWQRMLEQLGNLHDAGQQLADVSARAARAETEAEFLRERVADLREQLKAATGPADTTEPAETTEPGRASAREPGDATEPHEATQPGEPAGIVRAALRHLRSGRL